MEIYKEHGMWNGVTVSKVNKGYTELYWFTTKNAENGWHKWFIRHKLFLTKFIKYFEEFKNELHIKHTRKINIELFKFTQTFNHNLCKAEHHSNELGHFTKVVNILDTRSTLNNSVKEKTNLSPREIQLLAIISEGYTTKMAAHKMGIAPKTAEHYIEHIKKKVSLNYKAELIQLYRSQTFS